MSKVDLIMHPVRIRVITAVAGREMTVAQIAANLPDVAQATLYRHVNALLKGGVLAVVAENPIRGTVEKVYALAEGNPAQLGVEDVENLTKEDHMRLFTLFIATLTAQFGNYLNSRESIEMATDGVGYNTVPLYLTDAEFADLLGQISTLVIPYLQRGPGAGRVRRLLTTVVMPALDDASPDEAKENP